MQRRSDSVVIALFVFMGCSPAYPQTAIPSSSQTIVLQSVNPRDSSFILPATSTISTASGDGIDGNNSRNWQLIVQGVINAAGNGINLSSLNGAGVQITNNGTITGRNGNAILLNTGNSSVTLNDGSVTSGNILSNGSNNALILNGSGSTQGDFTGSSGFSRFTVNAGPGIRSSSGDILLSGSTMSSGVINSGLFVSSGTISATNSNAGITVAKNAILQIGNGGNTGVINVPVQVDGQLALFRSTESFTLNTPLAGAGVLSLRGTGVDGESSYVLNANSDTFSGNILIGSGARLQATDSTPTPQAHIYVDPEGTLWLGSPGIFTAPVFLKGNGWHEIGGEQLGALRLDSGATQSGAVTLLGDTRMTAVFSDYFGTISGDINDGGNGYSLEKTGAGQITLSGNNSYSGGTLISSGTLNVNRDANLGAASGPLTLGSGSTLRMSGGFSSTRPIIFNSGMGILSSAAANSFSGAISGAGQALIALGNITFAGNDSHTGGTTIDQAARLQIGAGGNSGTLNGNVVNNGTLTFNRSGTSANAGNITGPGTLIKQGSGTVTLSGNGSSQSSVEVQGGKLAFAPTGSFISTGDVTTANNATTSVANGGVLQVGGTVQQAAQANLEVSVLTTHPAVVATEILLAGALKLSGAIASATEAASKTLTILHSTTPAGISGDFATRGFSNPADYLQIYGGKANGDTDYNLSFGLSWLAGPALGDGDFTLNNATDNFNVNVVLNNQAGPFSSGWDGKTLTKAGPGTLILSQQNGYTGATQINGGTLQTNIADAMASSSSVSIASGGTLALNNFDQQLNNLSGAGNIALGSATLTENSLTATQFSGAISGGGSLVKEGSATLTLGGNSSYSGGTQINAGAVTATTGGAFGSGTVNNATLLTLDFSRNSVMNNVLSGNGTLLKTGTGIATLTGAGSTAGRVETRAGTLLLAQKGSFNTRGDFVTHAGAITAVGRNGSITTGGTFDVDGRLSLLAGGVKPVVQATQITLDPASSLNIAGLVSAENATEAQLAESRYLVMLAGAPGALHGDFGSLHIGGAASTVDFASATGFVDALQQRYDVGIRLNWYAQHSDTPALATGTFTLTNADESFELVVPLINQQPNPLTGWDGKTLTKNGKGTLILSEKNGYTGPTLINGGILQMGIADALLHSSNIAIAAGAVLALNDFDQHLNQLSGSGAIALGAATFTLNNPVDNTFSGPMSGTGNLSKSGSGSLFLTADSTYTGSTTVNAGTLALGTAQQAASLASTQVTVARGATFGGYGRVAGSVDNQGTLAVADALPAFSGGAPGNFIIGKDLHNSGNLVMASPVPASTLTVNGNYTGNNGLLTLSTTLGGDDSATDKLVILGNSAGTTRVQINNAGGKGAATVKGIELISVAGQSDGVFTQANRVVAGAYDYFLQKGAADGNWYLRSQPSGPPTPGNQTVRPEAGSYIANLAAARTLFNQRLEDRNGRAENSSLWLRQMGAHTGFHDDSGQLKTTTNRYVVQGGGELLSGQFSEKDSLSVGVMMGYGNAASNSNSSRSSYQSKGKVDGYSGGLYATWYQDAKTQQGIYADSWLQYSWLKADVNGEALSRENYDINGFSASVESGYRQAIYHGEMSDVYLTPQAQLIWEGQSVDVHTESNGTRVSANDDNNLFSRIGVKLSRDGVATADRERGKLFTTYVEANWLHNTHAVGVAFDAQNSAQAGGRNIGELKLGVEGKLSPRLQVWGNVGQQLGGDGYSDLSGVMGVSYQF
jgi:outer membrane autotransporter protein